MRTATTVHGRARRRPRRGLASVGAVTRRRGSNSFVVGLWSWMSAPPGAVERAPSPSRSPTTGPWWDGDVNVELLEAVLSYSRASGPARMLLATMAALADDDGTVRELSAEQLCAAAGVTDRTYRRARRALLASGELVLMSGTGGRGNTNVWAVADPRHVNGTEPARAMRRVPPPAGARPLVADTRAGAADTSTSSAAVKGGQDRTVSAPKVSDPYRGFRTKGWSGSDTFRACAAGNPGTNPGENPGRNPGA